MLLLDSLNLTPLIQQPSQPVEKEEMRSMAREQNGEAVLPGSRSLGCPVASLPNHRAKTGVGVPQGEHDGGRVRKPAEQVPGAGAFHRKDRKPGLYYGAWRRLARPKVISGESPMTLSGVSPAPIIGSAYATGPSQRHLSPGGPASLNSELMGGLVASQTVWGQSRGGPVWVRGRSHVDRARLCQHAT